MGLAFACDVRIGTKDAVFTLSEVKLGLSPATISKHVAREWGTAFTREAMLSARPIPFHELLSLGIVSKMVERQDGLDEALDEYLVTLRRAAPRASTLAKELVRASVNKEGQDESIKRVFEEMMTGDESEYGLREFQAGRRDVDWDVYTERKGRAKL